MISLIFIGAGTLFFSYYWTTKTTLTVPPLSLNQLVFTDSTTKINIDQKSSGEILAEINAGRQDGANSLNNIFLLTSSTSTGSLPLSRTSWFNLLSINTPISFNHFLIDDSNFGISNYGTSSIWFILKTDEA